MIIEYWSFERNGVCGKWIEVRWDSQRIADVASAAILRDDESITCIHRSKAFPENERPEPSCPVKEKT